MEPNDGASAASSLSASGGSSTTSTATGRHPFFQPRSSGARASSSSGSTGAGAGATTVEGGSGGSSGSNEGERDPMDLPVAPGCPSVRELERYHKRLVEARNPPKGYDAVLPWENHCVNLQPYGTLAVKKTRKKRKTAEGVAEVVETTEYRFLCNLSRACRTSLTSRKLGDRVGNFSTSNTWTHLHEHGISSSTGQTRLDNKTTYNDMVRAAENSLLRQEDPQRYFELQLTDVFFIGQLAPFALGNKKEFRVMIAGLQQQARAGLPPEVAADMAAKKPLFNPEAFHDYKIRVRLVVLIGCWMGGWMDGWMDG